MQKENIYETESVWKLMLRMCLPSIVIMLIQVVYSMTDMFFIGMLEDVNQLAAVSLAGPMLGVQSALGQLIGGGGCAVIARALGEKNSRVKDAAMGACISMGLLLGVGCTLVTLLGMEWILPALGATEETAAFTRSYLRIIAIGSPLTVFSQGIPGTIRAEGSLKEPMIASLLGTFTNMLLDPLFILAFRWGAAGAAAATVLGHLASSLYLLRTLIKGNGSFSIRPGVLFPAMKASPKVFGSVLALGVPSAAGIFLSNFAGTMQNRFYSGYGVSTVAAFSVAGKATMVVSMVAMGLCIGIQPVLAYFYGAGSRGRLFETIRKSGLTATIACLVLSAGCCIFSERLVQLFVTDAATVALGVKAARIGLLGAPLLGIYYLCTNLLQASGNAVSATVATILRQGLVLVPVLYLMHMTFGLTGLLWAGAVCDLLSTAAASILTFKTLSSSPLKRAGS